MSRMKHKSIRYWVLSAAKAFLVLYVSLVLALYFTQRSILYHPAPSYVSPQEAGVDWMEEVDLTAADGIRIKAWYSPAPSPDAKTVVFFHGNGGRLASYRSVYIAARQQGLGILAVEYRGYGGSEGSPTEQGLYADGRAGVEYLLKDKVITPEKLVIMGLSLGTGVATKLATEYDAHLLVLAAPFRSIAAVAAERYWYVPVEYLVKDPFDSFARIDKVKMPLFIFHSRDDRIVPYVMGVQLYGAAKVDKRLFTLEEQGHNNIDFGFIMGEVAAYESRPGGDVAIP